MEVDMTCCAGSIGLWKCDESKCWMFGSAGLGRERMDYGEGEGERIFL